VENSQELIAYVTRATMIDAPITGATFRTAVLFILIKLTGENRCKKAFARPLCNV